MTRVRIPAEALLIPFSSFFLKGFLAKSEKFLIKLIEKINVRITTKRGDGGKTTLMNGEVVSKNSPIIKNFACLDKIMSFLGTCENEKAEYVQNLLYKVLGELSFNKDIKEKYIKEVEKEIKELEKLPEIKEFIIPKGEASCLHFARALVRECEIKAVELGFKNFQVFLNRLSDYLFLVAYEQSLKEKTTKTFK